MNVLQPARFLPPLQMLLSLSVDGMVCKPPRQMALKLGFPPDTLNLGLSCASAISEISWNRLRLSPKIPSWWNSKSGVTHRFPADTNTSSQMQMHDFHCLWNCDGATDINRGYCSAETWSLLTHLPLLPFCLAKNHFFNSGRLNS